MSELTKSEIKAALSALEKKRREDPKLRKALRAQMQTRRRRGEKVLRAYLKKTGFDFEAYEKIRVQNQAEMRQLLKQAQAIAVKRSSSVKKDLGDRVESWRQSIERVRDGTLVSQVIPAYEVEETPFLIWPTNGLEFVDSHIEPWNNTAKIRAEWSDSEGNENLRFIFVWRNPSDSWAVVDVVSNLTLKGSCDAFAEGGFLFGSLNTVFVKAVLNVWEWWNQPPTTPPPQATQTQNVLALGADGGGFLSLFGGGSVESASASGSYDLRRTLFTLPPGGVAVFEVMLEFAYYNLDGGMIQVGFAYGDNEVKCPAVAIAVLS
jgi:hypothetical protein